MRRFGFTESVSESIRISVYEEIIFTFDSLRCDFNENLNCSYKLEAHVSKVFHCYRDLAFTGYRKKIALGKLVKKERDYPVTMVNLT